MIHSIKFINMNISKQIPAFLLAFVFIVFGANYFLHFIPMPAPTKDDAGDFAGLLYKTGFLAVVKVLEVIIGILLVLKLTRALALLLIAPIVVNIFLFEIVIAHKPGIGVALLLINVIGIILSKEKYFSIISK